MKKDIIEKAKAGDVESMFRLAGHLYAGRGCEQSYTLAREWYEAAADAGHVKAKCELGLMYLAGLGGEESAEKAAELFKAAADAGSDEAKFELGAMYASGNGVKKNFVKAMKLLRESGTYQASALLGEAPGWWEAPAKQGIAEAQYQLGLCYVNAYGLPQDYITGRYWLLKAANQGNAKAYDALSQMYKLGLSVEKSDAKASYFLKCYCDIKELDYEEFGLTGEETIPEDELDPEQIELPVYATTGEPEQDTTENPFGNKPLYGESGKNK